MLQNGLRWLSAQQKRHVSSKVLYCRDDEKLSVDAVLGRTSYETVDENGFSITGHAIDFLIHAADLVLIPMVGDMIVADGIVHEVVELGSDGCWRWCDPHGIRRRIHTKIYTVAGIGHRLRPP